MLSKTKFYLLIATELGWALIVIVVSIFLLEKYEVKNRFLVEIALFIVFALTSGWIPTYSYKKYRESEELRKQTEFWKNWKKKSEKEN